MLALILVLVNRKYIATNALFVFLSEIPKLSVNLMSADAGDDNNAEEESPSKCQKIIIMMLHLFCLIILELKNNQKLGL